MAPSLWNQYVTELLGGRTKLIEHEWGFISYSLPDGDSVFAEDIYIIPECRDAAHALRLLVEVERAGLSAGKTHTMFIIRLDSPQASYNMRIYLAMGFVLVLADNARIFLKREILKGE